MARRHGWGGDPPKDDDDARDRIIRTAIGVLDEVGAADFTLSRVAEELGVIRQTVYRYFPSTEELFSAVGRASVEDFVRELAEVLDGIDDPVTWAVEATAAVVERLPERPYLTLLLASGRSESFLRSGTSAVAVGVTRRLVELSAIDWGPGGVDSAEMDELIEVMLRLSLSLVVDPPEPPRDPDALRSFLRRWIGSGITTP